MSLKDYLDESGYHQFNKIIRSALIKCMYELNITEVILGELDARKLEESKITLEVAQCVDRLAWRITCPELAEAQKQKKKQLPWDENKNEEIEITIEEA